jgi:hypothetical protein
MLLKRSTIMQSPTMSKMALNRSVVTMQFIFQLSVPCPVSSTLGVKPHLVICAFNE